MISDRSSSTSSVGNWGKGRKRDKAGPAVGNLKVQTSVYCHSGNFQPCTHGELLRIGVPSSSEAGVHKPGVASRPGVEISDGGDMDAVDVLRDCGGGKEARIWGGRSSHRS